MKSVILQSCTPVKSVEEMAAVLGLNMDSPTFCFSSTKRNLVGQAGATKPRSSRRTTMVPKELKQSLVSGASNGTMGLRRSARCVEYHRRWFCVSSDRMTFDTTTASRLHNYDHAQQANAMYT